MVPALSAMARAAIAVRVWLEDIKQRLINRRAPRQRQFPRCSIHTLGSVRMLASARVSRVAQRMPRASRVAVVPNSNASAQGKVPRAA